MSPDSRVPSWTQGSVWGHWEHILEACLPHQGKQLSQHLNLFAEGAFCVSEIWGSSKALAFPRSCLSIHSLFSHVSGDQSQGGGHNSCSTVLPTYKPWLFSLAWAGCLSWPQPKNFYPSPTLCLPETWARFSFSDHFIASRAQSSTHLETLPSPSSVGNPHHNSHFTGPWPQRRWPSHVPCRFCRLISVLPPSGAVRPMKL